MVDLRNRYGVLGLTGRPRENLGTEHAGHRNLHTPLLRMIRQTADGRRQTADGRRQTAAGGFAAP
jgi:hypothetical protein